MRTFGQQRALRYNIISFCYKTWYLTSTLKLTYECLNLHNVNLTSSRAKKACYRYLNKSLMRNLMNLENWTWYCCTFFFGKQKVRSYKGCTKNFIFFSHIKGRFIFVAFFFYLEMINMDLSSRVEDGNNATPIHLSDIYYWKDEKSRAGFIVFDIGMFFSVCMMIKLVKGRISS